VKYLKIIITGSNGYIGSFIVQYLKNNHNIIGIGRASKSLYEGIKYIDIDISTVDFVDRVYKEVSDCDVIIHAAACIDYNNLNIELIDVNIKGTLNILKLAVKLKAKKIIYTSSIPVIGKPLNIPITENHLTSPESLYHITKLSAEYVVSLSSKFKIDYYNFRFSSPIGPGMKKNIFLVNVIEKCLLNEDIIIYGNGTRIQNYIDVRDISENIEKSLLINKSGTYNLSGTSISNKNLVHLCIDLTKSKSKIIYSGEDIFDDYFYDVSTEKAVVDLGFKYNYKLINTLEDMINEIRKRV
jgi:UDP-glucose 4-epimerase